MKRAVIFCFYDKDGIVDDYVLFYLKQLKMFSEDIYFVVNGKIKTEYKIKLKKIVDYIIVRENVGYDAWAYKAGLEYIGYDNLKNYDEIITCNDSVFGGIYSFKNLFNKMEKRTELDFWGISIHPKMNGTKNKGLSNFIKKCKYNYLPEHIQQYFVVYRKRLLISKEFKKYWKNLRKINDYIDAVGKHEIVCTKYFEDAGFKWDVFIDKKMQQNTNLVFFYPYDSCIKCKTPILKRKTFIIEGKFNPDNLTYKYAVKTVKQLKKNGYYNVNMIKKYLNRKYSINLKI